MKLKLIAAAVAAIVMSGPAQAGMPVFYDDRGTFEAALAGSPIFYESFEDLPLANNQASFTTDRFTVTSTDGPGIDITTAASSDGNQSLRLDGGALTVRFDTFDTPVFAFGTDVIDLGDLAVNSFTISFADGTQTVLQDIDTNQNNAVLFAGVISMGNAITSLTVNHETNANGEGIFLDQVTTAVIPEPSTWIMMILGFGLVALRLQRKSRSAVATA